MKAISRIGAILVFSCIFLFALTGWVQADTYESSYGSSRTHNVNTTSGTHKFIVDGIWGKEVWTEWYVNRNYKETDHSYWVNNYTDPSYSCSISSGTIEIKALLYDSDWNYFEYHKWNVSADTTKPSNPSSFSSSPSNNVWTTDNTIYVSWSGASDNVGLKRYYYKWSQSSSSSVSTSDSYSNTSSGAGSKTSPALSDGTWYFHIRYMDTSGNLASSTAHYGPFKIDRTKPSKPSLSSPADHSSTSDRTPYLDWNNSSDSTSGIDHYEVEVYDWGLEPDISTTTSNSYYQIPNALSFKKWYWKIRGVDRAGNKSDWSDEWDFTVFDNVKPSNPTSYSGNPSANVWTTDNTVNVSWSAASDSGSGIDGYSYQWSTSSSTVPDTTKDISGTSTTSGGLADGTWYLHVRAVDKAGNWAYGALHCGPFKIDRTDPGKPSHQSPTNNGTVDTLRPTVIWSAASDGGSGVQKYHLKVVESWFPYIDKVDKDVTGTSYTLSSSEALKWEKAYTWRLYAIDGAGNKGDYTAEWRFTVHDGQKPGNPTSYTSSPPKNVWTTDNTVNVSWSAASDSGSGIDGYSYQWSTSSSTVPDTTKDISGTSTTSGGLADGTWYLHVRAVDKAGNWAYGALHCGPFKIDRTDPDKPSLNNPYNNGTVNTTRPLLTWSSATDDLSGIKEYQLLVETDMVGVNKVNKRVSGTSYTLSEMEALKAGDSYKWKVYAVDNAGNVGPWSDQWTFFVTHTDYIPNYQSVHELVQLDSDCGPVSAGTLMGYWEDHGYWNIIFHGNAENGATGPVKGKPDTQNSEGLVHGLRNAMSWTSGSGVTPPTERDGIKHFCNESEYQRNLNFATNWDTLWTYNALKAEILAGKPVLQEINFSFIQAATHWMPVFGFMHTASAKFTLVHDNWSNTTALIWCDWDEGFGWPDWDLGTLAIVKVNPGGTPADHYEDDDTRDQAWTIDPNDDYNWLQTHNFYTASDHDWVKFTASADNKYEIKIENPGSKASARLYVYKASNMSQAVASDTDGGTASVSFDCLADTPTDADTYYIHVTNANWESGPQTNYDLTIEEIPIEEAIATPITPNGQDNGKKGEVLAFTATGAASNLGHPLEYQFWWDTDGVSEWGSANQTHVFNTTGTKSIRVKARCVAHPDRSSEWSPVKQVNIEYCVLTMTVVPLGSGTISATPAGVALTGILENTYRGYGWNETVELKAQANLDWRFDHWGGDLSGTTNPDSITMNGDKAVTAYFVEDHSVETISAPGTPTGETIPIVGRTYTYTTAGATSNLGHTVEYKFNWGDGTTSEWSTSNSASHIWLDTTPRLVTASARCQTHTDKTNISAGLTVTPVEETILTVESPYGTPSPEVGHTDYPKGKEVTAGVDSPVSGDAGVRYVCTGWIGAGSVPPSGTITSVTFTINEESSIAWHWKTQYQLNIHVSEGGTVSPESGGWYDAGTEVMLIATPDECFALEGWGGDLTGNETTKNLVMDGPKSINAAFIHMRGDTNGDGNVDLTDVILALQVISGMNPSGIRSDYASSGTDVNGDGKIGLEEVIYILQKVAGLRE